MPIVWKPYEDPLSRFVKDHPSWDDDDVADGYRADKESWRDPASRPEPYEGPLANTALGLLGLDKERLAFCTYSLWIAHTDFNVTRHHLHVLSRLVGVEVLKPVGRYTFLLGAGPLFDAEAVKAAAERALGQRRVNRVEALARWARSAGVPAWAILAGPSGELDVITGGDAAEVDAALKAEGELWEVVKRA